MLVGSHVSIAGSLALPFVEAKEIGCDAIQIFVKPPRKLMGIKPFTPEQIATWKEARKASPVKKHVVHANYLINLAGDEHTQEYSRVALLDEMKRCHELEVETLVFHPGQHRGQGEAEGLARIADNLEWALKKGKDYDDVTVCLENMAGQGSMLGYDFVQIKAIHQLVDQPDRLGMCFDTCHAHAAGYEMRTPEGYAKTMEVLDATVGLDKVKAFHLNDSKMDFGLRVDRHAAIGKGTLGDGAFKLLLQDARWKDHPGVVETPHDDNKGFAQDVARLKKLAKEPFTKKDLPRQKSL